MAKETRVPQLPAIPRDVSREARRWMEAVKEVIEVREGTRGLDLDTSVTFRDLIDANIDISSLNIRGAPKKQPPGRGGVGGSGENYYPDLPLTQPPGNIDPLPFLNVPPMPESVSASGGVGIVWLSWKNPLSIYSNHKYAEIRRGESTVFSESVQIGTANGSRYVDRLTTAGDSKLYYYWVRFVNLQLVPGPWITDPVSAGNIYEILKAQIQETFLFSALKKRIDLIDAASSIPGSVNNRIEAKADETLASAEETTVAYVGEVNDNVRAFTRAVFGQDTVPNRVVSLAAQVDSVQSKANRAHSSVQRVMASYNGGDSIYAVKIQTDAYGRKAVAGFGLSSHASDEGIESSFVVLADKFAVVLPAHEGYAEEAYPFTVGRDTNNRPIVVIKNTAIGDATITNAKIVDLDASKIKSGTIEADTEISLASGRLTMKTFVSTWYSGGVKHSENNAHIVVYDNNGRARVQLGCATDGTYGPDSFGLWVWDKNGKVKFDANGARVFVDNELVNDLWVGGYKATVPQGEFSGGTIALPLNANESTVLQYVNYDPQGCRKITFQVGFGYHIYHTFEIPESTTGWIKWFVGVYPPWSSDPAWYCELLQIDCQPAPVMGGENLPIERHGYFYASPDIVIPESFRYGNRQFRVKLGCVHYDYYGVANLGDFNLNNHANFDVIRKVWNRSALVCGLRS